MGVQDISNINFESNYPAVTLDEIISKNTQFKNND